MIETNNIYYASYLLTEGLSISNVEKQYDDNFKNTVVFYLSSGNKEHEKQLEQKYISGIATTNIRSYLDNLIKVRDIIYNVMDLKKASSNKKIKLKI